jgi:uncharacterized membrane protein required for colicin V production
LSEVTADNAAGERSRGWIRVLAITATLFAFSLFIGGSVLPFFTPEAQGVDTWGSGSPIGGVLTFAPLLAFTIVGGLITIRRPSNLIGWICLASGIGWSLIYFYDSYVGYGLAVLDRRDLPLADWMFVFIWSIPAGLLGTFLLLYFPNGRLPSPRWRKVAVLCAVTLVLVSFNTGFVPEAGEAMPPEIPNAVAFLYPIARAFDWAIILLPVCFLLCAASLAFRYRRASVEDRQRLKWMAFAAAIVACVYAVAVAGSIGGGWDSETTPPLWSAIQTLSLMSFGLIPTAVGFAVLRYRLYDIDRIISRTLSYAVVSLVLIGVYLAVVLTSAALVGSAERPDWIVAVGTLIAVFLFAPVRRRVQAGVDRRFNRKRYDAARTVSDFTSGLRARVDLDDVCASLGQVVRTTLAPADVWVWVPTPTSKRAE